MRKAHSLIQRLIEPFQPSFSEGHISESERSKRLISLRWFALAMQLLIIYPALQLDYLLLENLRLYAGVVLALMAFNLIAPRLESAKGLYLQLTVDLSALCTLLVLTAGCHNPFSALLFISAILGPMFLSKSMAVGYLVQTAIGLTIVCSFTEPLLMNAHGEAVSPVLTMAAKIMVLFILGGLTIWLKACLERSQARYETLYKQRQRLNNFRAVGVVTGQLSHELSTPLNTIKLMMDRIGRNPDMQTSGELKIARAALAQCEQSIKDLFDCKVDAESLSFKETPLAEFIQGVCKKWQLDFPEVKLDFGVDETVTDLNYRIPATPFAQAVLDILDNAKEASEHESVSITVDMQLDRDAILIHISDRGRGIDQSISDRLGEPFVSTKSTGTGLGVYNASALLEALGGSLGMKPRFGGGTKVSMVLPR
jgi:two-component system sensor histidine kinase RegB